MFRCRYCKTYFLNHHSDDECRDTILEMIYQLLLKLDRHRLHLIYNNCKQIEKT